jgi:hypothetical protein
MSSPLEIYSLQTISMIIICLSSENHKLLIILFKVRLIYIAVILQFSDAVISKEAKNDVL